MTIETFSNNTHASIVPVVLIVLAIFVSGAYYSMLFLEIGIPEFADFIPNSSYKTIIMMGIGAIPLIIVIVGLYSFYISGQKRGGYYQ